MIKAVFFDMDGTIADSEKIVWKVTRDLKDADMRI